MYPRRPHAEKEVTVTDLEITKLCAEAMDIPRLHIYAEVGGGHGRYDPLHDDAQAMALVKKFNFKIDTHSKLVSVQGEDYGWDTVDYHKADDLNRAICECVAKMQSEKRK